MRTKATTFGVVALWLTGVSGPGAQVSQQGSPRASAAQEFTFANVAWGSSPEKVEAAMASQGLTFYRKLGEDNLLFTGRLMDQKVAAYAMMAHDSVVRADEAIAADTASFLAAWGEDEEKTQTMWLNLEHLDVVLSYETPAFVREANKKRARPF